MRRSNLCWLLRANPAAAAAVCVLAYPSCRNLIGTYLSLLGFELDEETPPTRILEELTSQAIEKIGRTGYSSVDNSKAAKEALAALTTALTAAMEQLGILCPPPTETARR